MIIKLVIYIHIIKTNKTMDNIKKTFCKTVYYDKN